MPCACSTNSSTGKKLTYQVTLPNGEHKSYPSEIEAKAAVARAGGGTIRPQ